MFYSAPIQTYAQPMAYSHAQLLPAPGHALHWPQSSLIAQPHNIYQAPYLQHATSSMLVKSTSEQTQQPSKTIPSALPTPEETHSVIDHQVINSGDEHASQPTIQVSKTVEEVTIPNAKKKLPFAPPVKIPLIQSSGQEQPSHNSANRRSIKLNAVTHPFPETPKVDVDDVPVESKSPRMSAHFQPTRSHLRNVVKIPFSSQNPSPVSSPSPSVSQKIQTPSETPRLSYNPIGISQDLSGIDLSKSLAHGEHTFFRAPTTFRSVKIHIYEVMEIPNTNGDSGTTLCVQVKLNGIEKRSSVMYHVKKNAIWDRMNTSGEHNMKFEGVPCDAEIQVAILDLTGIGASVIGSTKVLLRSHTQWYWMKPSGAIHLEVKAN